MRDIVAVVRDTFPVLIHFVSVGIESLAALRDTFTVVRDSFSVARDTFTVVILFISVLKVPLTVLKHTFTDGIIILTTVKVTNSRFTHPNAPRRDTLRRETESLQAVRMSVKAVKECLKVETE